MRIYNTTKGNKGQHLHLNEKFNLEQRITVGDSSREISQKMDRPNSTINYEIKKRSHYSSQNREWY